MCVKPLIGITSDLCDSENGERSFVYRTYVRAVLQAGGLPVALPPCALDAGALLDRLDGVVLTGGDDPRTEPYGVPSHPSIVPVRADRQRFETDLLCALNERPSFPVLGVCLGMQMMALHAGGQLDQHMPDTRPDWQNHWKNDHPIVPSEAGSVLVAGTVHSRHRQCVQSSGSLAVLATADDGVIEAVCDPARSFWIGVQWHPERTEHHALGAGLFERLVNAACANRQRGV